MADGPPHARGIAPGRTALPALLVVVRIAVLALVILGAGRRPVTDVQVLHAERINRFVQGRMAETASR